MQCGSNSVYCRHPAGAKDGHKAFKAVSEAYEVSALAVPSAFEQCATALTNCKQK